MFKRILFLVESAAQAPQVVPLVQLLAAHGPLDVTLVRAYSGMPDSDTLHATSAELDQLATRLRAETVDAHYLLEFDTAEMGILDAAKQTKADLIVLAPHTRHGLEILTHPSVTKKLLTSAEAPLLIWPERVARAGADDFLHLPGAVVIAPLDGGELAERALPYAVDLANMFRSSLFLVRITPDVTTPMSLVAETALVTPEILRAEQEEARLYLENVRERYENDVAMPIQSLALTGAPAGRIRDLAQAHLGSVIVMNTHGRGPLGRVALGSVTAEVIREGATPVVAIPPHAPAPLAQTAPLTRPTVVAEG
jgi:nucleotide-binding universal stress UspA family protein